MRLRPVEPTDFEQIWAIEQSVFAGEAWSRDLLQDELSADHRVYLALIDDEGAVRGYGGVLVVAEECDVQTISLDPAIRGAGLGKSLMNALLDEAQQRRATQAFLEVRADNSVARSMYASLGFDEIGVRPRYYQPDDIDAIVMKLELKDRR